MLVTTPRGRLQTGVVTVAIPPPRRVRLHGRFIAHAAANHETFSKRVSRMSAGHRLVIPKPALLVTAATGGFANRQAVASRTNTPRNIVSQPGHRDSGIAEVLHLAPRSPAKPRQNRLPSSGAGEPPPAGGLEGEDQRLAKSQRGPNESCTLYGAMALAAFHTIYSPPKFRRPCQTLSCRGQEM